MIEIKKLEKTYSSKGTDVKALKDVTLQFPEQGMVFIMGKSGCGKTTLLNCIGGLDTVTNGEIIIDGKSSKSFESKDYDEYRNFYFGYVFQEYNLLSKLTVGDNIGLALRLQGKNSALEDINKVLHDINLDGYNKRRVNKISGGERQRIAIARAFIKNANVILADEPTGSLDSGTGEQIYNILQGIAKEKLVIVVTHDQVSAEKYGDFIIEMEDGVVVSERKNEPQTETIITESKTTQNNEIKMKKKKAGLKTKDILKLGLKGLISKPIRATMSIILITVALITLGLFLSTSQFFKDDYLEKLIIKNEDYNFTITQHVVNRAGEHAESNLSKAELDEIEELTGNEYGYTFEPLDLVLRGITQSYNYNRYFVSNIAGMKEINEEYLKANDFEYVGVLPNNYNELAVSEYIFEHYQSSGFFLLETYYPKEEITSKEDFLNLNPSIKVGDEIFDITAIIDTKINDDKYKVLQGDYNVDQSGLENDHRKYVKNGIPSCYFVKEGFEDYYNETVVGLGMRYTN